MKLQLLSIDYVRANHFKLIATLICCASYAGIGSVSTLLGSSLLDFQILINENFQTVAYLVQQRAAGYVLGALLAGFVEKYVNSIIFLSLSNLALGLSVIVAPWLDSFWPLSVAIVTAGIALGVLEIFLNIYTAHVWKAESTNYLQALHMFFDIGALVAPLITRPYLLPLDADDYNEKLDTSTNSTKHLHFTKDDVLIQYPHLFLGLFLVLVAISYLFVYFHGDDGDEIEDQVEQHKNTKVIQNAKWKQNLAIILTALIVNFEFGGQNLVSSLGPAFGVKSDLKMDKQDAALLVTLYWSVACIYRLVLIPLTILYDEATLIIANVAIVIVGASVMAAGADHNLTMAWVSFAILSMGFSPCFAFSFGLIQRYFSVSSRVASIIFFVGTLGESVHPWVVANYMESASSFYTTYFATIAFINSFLCIFLVILMLKFFKRPGQNREEYQELD